MEVGSRNGIPCCMRAVAKGAPTEINGQVWYDDDERNALSKLTLRPMLTSTSPLLCLSSHSLACSDIRTVTR